MDAPNIKASHRFERGFHGLPRPIPSRDLMRRRRRPGLVCPISQRHDHNLGHVASIADISINLSVSQPDVRLYTIKPGGVAALRAGRYDRGGGDICCVRHNDEAYGTSKYFVNEYF
jgi:hypothetical protein